MVAVPDGLTVKVPDPENTPYCQSRWPATVRFPDTVPLCMTRVPAPVDRPLAKVRSPDRASTAPDATDADPSSPVDVVGCAPNVRVPPLTTIEPWFSSSLINSFDDDPSLFNVAPASFTNRPYVDPHAPDWE